jgi:hypothetical protein
VLIAFTLFAVAAVLLTLTFLYFSGRAGLMTPFIYYHFLTLRYSSRRNPHTRNMFHELRLATENIANNPKAPPIIGKVLHGAIRLVSRLAPAQVPQQQHNE